MHSEAYQAMSDLLDQVHMTGAACLDVGSYNVNGTYRKLVEARGWKYTGLDLCAGPNVDVVAPDPYQFPFKSGSFDVVITGSTMEHVKAIWLWVPELARVLKSGGMLAIVTHWKFQEHRYPVDCWRILPDGMRYLFESTGVLREIDVRIASPYDIAALAEKK